MSQIKQLLKLHSQGMPVKRIARTLGISRNTVKGYLRKVVYLTAMCRNLYGYIIRSFSKRFKGLKSTDRLKKFIYRFVAVPAKWIRRSRQNILKVHGDVELRE